MNSAFLLVDVDATVRGTTGDPIFHGYPFLFMYVIAPEKFVAFALFREGVLDKQGLGAAALLGGALLDLCGVAALGAGVGAGNLAARARRGPRCRRARGAVHGRGVDGGGHPIRGQGGDGDRSGYRRGRGGSLSCAVLVPELSNFVPYDMGTFADP